MSDNSIEEKVRSIIVEQLGVESDKVTADANSSRISVLIRWIPLNS